MIFGFQSLKFTNIWDNLEKKEGTYNLIELINKSKINTYFIIAPASKVKKVVTKKDQKQKVIKKEKKPKVTKK